MTYEYIPKLIRAALNNDRKNVEAIALFLFSFLPHIILPDFLSYIIPILEFIIGSLILLLATLITSLNSFSSKFSSSSSSAYITPH